MHLTSAHLVGTANGWYRTILPLRELERRGHRVTWQTGAAVETGPQGEAAWELIHFHQAVNDDNLAMMRRLRERGVAVVWDADDDVRWIPKFCPTYTGRRKLKKQFSLSVEMARTAHLMTTPSSHLADTYREAGAEHVAVIENQLLPAHLRLPRRATRGVTIGYTAAIEHGTEVRELRLPELLRSLLDTNPRVRVVTIGIHLEFEHPRYVYRPLVPIQELIEQESDFDIGIAPLVDSPFNRARSNVKLKEYAAAGAAWLASPVGPYAGMGEQQGGELVGDRDWPQALAALVDDDARRKQLAARGAAWVKKQTIAQTARVWEGAFADAIQRARAERGAAVATPR